MKPQRPAATASKAAAEIGGGPYAHRRSARARTPQVTAAVSISRGEAMELRNALELVMARGISAWKLDLMYAEVEASITLTLELDVPRNKLSPV